MAFCTIQLVLEFKRLIGTCTYNRLKYNTPLGKRYDMLCGLIDDWEWRLKVFLPIQHNDDTLNSRRNGFPLLSILLILFIYCYYISTYTTGNIIIKNGRTAAAIIIIPSLHYGYRAVEFSRNLAEWRTLRQTQTGTFNCAQNAEEAQNICDLQRTGFGARCGR